MVYDIVDGTAVGETHYNSAGTATMYMMYIHDENGAVNGIGLWYPGDTEWTYYYFVKNLQGDVLKIYGDIHNCVATYTYDSWGNVLTKSGSLAEINPFRYRSYYFDNETWFYYLQSRYYDPAIGRFINADVLTSTGQGILGNNMFAYCNNCPVNCIDIAGQYPCTVLGDRGNVISQILHACNDFAVGMGIDTAAIGAGLLDMYETSEGIYHAILNCWQQYFGYNDLYDFFFNIGTSMEAKNFKFTHDGMEYIIWAWKGDYINLGAGAELGIYYGGGPHWRVNTDIAMPMTLSLDNNGSSILSYSATTWWITGFNSNYLNVQASSLTATYSLDFSSNPGMYNSFYNTHYGTPGWTFNKGNCSALLVF